jgi:molybdopterin-guanine dinucleotide biosynthesis protein A
MTEDNILAVVLAGGKSRRFGSNKSEIMLKDKKLIDHTLEKLETKFKKIIIISNELNFKNYTTIKDCVDGQLGPLAGVLSAMKWAKINNNNFNWIATFPCDTPFFNISIIEKFKKESKKKDNKLYFVKAKNKFHNIFGLWSMELIDQLEKDLVINEERKVENWANKVGVKTINVEDEKYDTFFNINTKEDLKHAANIFDKINNDKL